MTKTLGARKSREIQDRIDRRLDLWERGLHVGLVGDALLEGRAREVCVARSDEEEKDNLARNFHSTLLSGKLRQAVRWANNREGGGLILGDVCTKTGLPVADVLRDKHPDIHVPPLENPTCMSFEEYKEVTVTVPLDFSEDDVMWVAFKLSGANG